MGHGICAEGLKWEHLGSLRSSSEKGRIFLATVTGHLLVLGRCKSASFMCPEYFDFKCFTKGYQYESTTVLDLIWCLEVTSWGLKEIKEQPQINFRKDIPYLHIYLCYTLCKNYFIVRYPVREKNKKHRSVHWSGCGSNTNCIWQKHTSDHHCSQIPGNKGQNMAQIPLLSSCTENSWYLEVLRLQHVALLKSRLQPWGACSVFQLKSDMHYMWTFGSHIVHHALHIIAWTFTVCSH